MRTVGGAADDIVVVGAGFAGLAAALHLAGRGRRVTVLEQNLVPGGRAGRLDFDGYRIDTGPTVLTMPDVLERAFAAVDATLTDHVELQRVAPAYRACFADGSELDVHSGEAAMAEAIRQFAGPAEEAGYRRLRAWLTALYDVEFDRFIAANVDSPLSLVTRDLARLVAMGGFRRLDRAVARFLSDERLRRVFTFQALYAGVPPQRALAAYAVIAYMDTVGGVWFPRGGMRALPDGLARAAVASGVEFHCGTRVTALERSGARVTAAITADGRRFACDAVVLTAELPECYRLLRARPRRPVPLRASPSAVVLHLGVAAKPVTATHHTVLFGRAWETTFRELLAGAPVADPSLLVSRPTCGDPDLAPGGRDLLQVTAPTANLSRGGQPDRQWQMDRLMRTLEDRLGTLDAQLLRVVTPRDWAREGMIAGSPFSLAHTLTQTGPFRPGNFPRSADNAVLAGASTVPGVGIPMALISGQLAADRITGDGAVRPASRPIRRPRATS